MLRSAATAAGRGLGALFAGVGHLRRGPRALHPRGEVYTGTLTIAGTADPSGVALLDEPGEHPCLVRLSRATGLPRPLPDVLGVAVRLSPAVGRRADLLFASTGTGPVSRYVLLPRGDHASASLTTLLPYRGPRGPLTLALVPAGRRRWDLWSAPARGEWTSRGVLTATTPGGDDEGLRFDPVGSPPEGLRQYDVVRRLRAPAYRDHEGAATSGPSR